MIGFYIRTSKPLMGVLWSKNHNRTPNGSHRSFQRKVGVGQDDAFTSKIWKAIHLVTVLKWFVIPNLLFPNGRPHRQRSSAKDYPDCTPVRRDPTKKRDSSYLDMFLKYHLRTYIQWIRQLGIVWIPNISSSHTSRNCGLYGCINAHGINENLPIVVSRGVPVVFARMP